MALLNVKKLSYSYDNANKKVLNNINIGFEKSKIYSIVGKSGAGKTTFLSLISGLDTCKDGEILYKEKNINKIDKDNYRAQSIGVIFQGYNLLTNYTAIENILLSMDISNVNIENKRKYVLELLNKVGIDNEKAFRKVLTLSGGEQQRVAIARALAHNPDIIIADEPTGNLDTETEDNILDILRKLSNEENKCVIIVTHSNKVALFADEVWALDNGNLLFIKQKRK
ncbi:ABC transporter ATP-binding protein [Clostridium sp. UBA6640]|uniref:ABC transporter ATP-binding protein n=1 Tax=Clostridium sp. UBA6640 TaxID=1946370 RepID=UPI0025C228C1|nr:ABC transporter ATP-binding protein [Clostridium sp. UBA6640]